MVMCFGVVVNPAGVKVAKPLRNPLCLIASLIPCIVDNMFL